VLSLLLSKVMYFVAATMTLVYQIDDQGYVYIDGVSLGYYGIANQVLNAAILGNTSVFAIQAQDTYLGVYLLVSLSNVGCLMNTATTWRCSSSAPPASWYLPTFDSSSWPVQSFACAPDASIVVPDCSCKIILVNLATLYCLIWLN
jgi:hypothetical protein